MITTILISSYHWTALVLFCLQKKRPEKTLLTKLLQYHSEKQIMPAKTTVKWLFNDI